VGGSVGVGWGGGGFIYDLLTFFAMFVSYFCLARTVLVIIGRY
jgi:hypothetical protein